MQTPLLVSTKIRPVNSQVIDEINGFSIEVCRTQESLETAFRIRYRAYLKHNALPINAVKMFYDGYDLQSNTRTHLVWYENNPVATVRSCIWSDQYDWAPTEALNYFPEDIEQNIGRERMLESNRFAVDPNFQGRRSLFAQILMFRIHALSTAVHQCNYIITVIRHNHAPFYHRFLGMERVSTNMKFIPWVDADTVLMAAQRSSSLETALKKGMPDFDEKTIARYAECAEIT